MSYTIKRISTHAMTAAMNRYDLDMEEARAFIRKIADNGILEHTPSGPAIRFQTDMLGVEPSNGGWYVVTCYPLTLRTALKKQREEMSLFEKPGVATRRRRRRMRQDHQGPR